MESYQTPTMEYSDASTYGLCTNGVAIMNAVAIAVVSVAVGYLYGVAAVLLVWPPV